MGDSYTVVATGFNTPTTPLLLSAPININTSGDQVVIAGVAGKVIRVFRIFALAASSVQMTPKDGTGGTAFTGPLTLGSFALDLDAESWFTTSASNAFVLNLLTSVQVSGRVYYTQV